MAQQRTALVIGATGLVGTELINQLCASEAYSRVTALVRKPLSTTHPKLAQEIVDFDNLEQAANRNRAIFQANDVFCTLGTTIRVAGSQEAFRKVDYDYPVQVAEIALRNGAEQYCIVTALGADARSPVFYSRVKGEVEKKISSLGYKTVLAFRPSFLLGKRTEARAGEEIGIIVARLIAFALIGPLRKYRAIEAQTVAGAMILEAAQNLAGMRVYESDAIQTRFDAGSR
jgi:uncharacterized protein YbjT (DUF2867 family)